MPLSKMRIEAVADTVDDAQRDLFAAFDLLWRMFSGPVGPTIVDGGEVYEAVRGPDTSPRQYRGRLVVEFPQAADAALSSQKLRHLIGRMPEPCGWVMAADGSWLPAG